MAIGAGNGLQGQCRLGLVVETVKDDAVGESLGGIVARGQGPEGLGGQGGLANAAGAAEGENAAGGEIGEELGEFRLAADEGLEAGRELEGEGRYEHLPEGGGVSALEGEDDVAVLVEHGGGGGSVAAPIARKVVEAYLLKK